MNQSAYRYLGLIDLALLGAFLVAFGISALATSPVLVGMLVAGVGLLLAGTLAAVSVGPATVTWRHFVGVSYTVFALTWPATYGPAVVAGTATRAELALFVATAVGSLSILAYGYDVFRDGRHFDVETDVTRTLEV
ncbi:hypothetical protein AMS69_15955 [Haloarcula rubripromontorii]|uniref:Uncharacterized protein n=1 Tax=Haloarcula rubripromontorii TaxID=1705562 RepID=A0A0M9AIB7_9EURY|nr:hypothetical protein [Haloarcula rubripromontorii]KOX92038.1 hypothetical protein AMS69_15955 [Haloarcula rubripromontorii]NLV06151.1 hypothetical protein [Haloarcula rubripromontorii]